MSQNRVLNLTANGAYLEELYLRWKENPSQVETDWQHFFEGFDFARTSRDNAAAELEKDQARVDSLISSYRNQGHLLANLDPLGSNLESHPELTLESLGFEENDLQRVFDSGTLSGYERLSLDQILKTLRATYCGTVGVEYRHIQERSIRRWLEQQMEPIRNDPQYDKEKKLEILQSLTDAEVFETFIQNRYPGQKRFSLEGAESTIAALHELIETAPDSGVEQVFIGMAHRGRLNVLADILRKPYAMIFSEFEDVALPGVTGGDGDVKYHKGFYAVRRTRSGREIAISLAANPSHLEAVDPVVEGRVRAKQRRLADTQTRSRVIPVLLHGDAAFAGQGLVAETLNLSQLDGYTTGGTIHFIINNQIGFTTTPDDARSTLYSTDVAKMVGSPILHVNGDDPEAVVYVTALALRFRQEFKRDVVVDMICYRRHGHNEGDEPAYTQPLLYKKIKDRPSVRRLYLRHLLDTEVLTEAQGEKIAESFKDLLQKAFEAVKEKVPSDISRPSDQLWAEYRNPYSHDEVETGSGSETLKLVGRALTTIPEGFQLNPKVGRRLPGAMAAIGGGGDIDWPTAELLAFGCLLNEGVPVRLSGQDSRRGTFSQRHAVWRDMQTNQAYVPLNHVSSEQARFCVYDSMLSEAAVLGFDYGYSLGEPQMLVLWEAQFGDFANGAQVIIDQFIVSSQAKWQQPCGLVMLLPHGFEGQGPEHSNAYLERYLAACAEENIQVCNLTTPAQYFHVLRRQVKRNFRCPLVIMTPKSLLRHPEAVSPVNELEAGGFQEILDDPTGKQSGRLVLCSGKVYYDLLAVRRKEDLHHIALVRVEQLYPINTQAWEKIQQRYKEVPEVVWAQEEPANRGGWSFISPYLQKFFTGRKILFAGRPASASPATGSHRIHRSEQQALVRQALGIEPVGT